MFEVTNNHYRPLSLADGTILAASGTRGARQDISLLTEFLRELAWRGLITIAEKAVNKVVDKIPTPNPDPTLKTEKEKSK